MSFRRLTLATLTGLATAALFIALAQTPAPAGAHTPGADEWQVHVGKTNGQPNGEVDMTWEGHTHDPDEWDDFSRTREVEWTGDPGPNPCSDPAHHGLKPDNERSHCAYVVVHYSPWEIDKPSLRQHADPQVRRLHESIVKSWCADINGSDAPAGAMRFNAEHVACTNKVDPHSNPFRQGDVDVLNQHQVLIDAGVQANANPDEIVSRGHHHSVNTSYSPATHAHGPTDRDEAHGHVAGFGAHWQAGGHHCRYFTQGACHGTTHSHEPANHTEHKTVMFWVWWERAADTEPLCDDGTQPPCPETDKDVPRRRAAQRPSGDTERAAPARLLRHRRAGRPDDVHADRGDTLQPRRDKPRPGYRTRGGRRRLVTIGSTRRRRLRSSLQSDDQHVTSAVSSTCMPTAHGIEAT